MTRGGTRGPRKEEENEPAEIERRSLQAKKNKRWWGEGEEGRRTRVGTRTHWASPNRRWREKWRREGKGDVGLVVIIIFGEAPLLCL